MASSISKKRARAWAFTLNNPTEEEKDDLKGFFTEKCKFAVMGMETGESGTKHIQGYVQWKSARTFSAMKGTVGSRAHIEPAKSNAQKNYAYCTKEDKEAWVFGEIPKQGKRGDLDEYRAMAAEEGMRAVVKTANFQQIRVSEKYLSYHDKSRDFKTKVYWHYGDSGTGKSAKARAESERLHPGDVYYKPPGSKWWCGYDGHACVVMDDFRSNWAKLDYMLNLLDRYPMQIETKGGSRQFRARRLYITTIKHPITFYTKPGPNESEREPSFQLLRRIHKLRKFTKVGEEYRIEIKDPEEGEDV